MKTGVHVADAMTIHVISVTPDFSVMECAKVMQANKIGALVVKEDGASIGILTERDVVRKAVITGKAMKSITAKDVMETKLITIEPSADLYEAILLMRDNDIRHLPVIQKKKMVGFLTVKDILKVEPQLFDLIVEKYNLREEERKPIHKQVPFGSASQEIESLING